MIKWLLVTLLLLIVLPSSPKNSRAQVGCPVGQGAIGGLISAPSISGFKSDLGVCNQDPSSAFTPYKIPAYDRLKSQYYTQAKQSISVTKHDPLAGNKTQADITAAIGSDHLYFINGNLNIDSNIPSGPTAVVFVEGNLNINSNFCYSTACPNGVVSPQTGIVFVVKGNVYIASTVTRIDAAIISEGFIYTAVTSAEAACIKNDVPASPLVIYGSFISINKSGDTQVPKIVFCRTLSAGNVTASEQINHQVKYLVILRNILSDTLQKWSEIQ